MKPVEAMTLGAVGAPRTWEAELDLGYAFRAGRTTLARRSSRGPLAVQKPLYPESEAVCHTILLHPPGAIAGGDDLAIRIGLEPHAHAVFATPGATKWYRSGGPASRQRIAIGIADNGVCEWLPQENIYFESVRADNAIDVKLGHGAVFCGWDVMCLGRTASGERFARGSVQQRIAIASGGRPLFEELSRIEGGSPILDSAAGMAGYPVCGSFLLAGTGIDAGMLAGCREVGAGQDCLHGVTRLPGAFVARFLGRSAEQARDYFSRIWEILRPAYANRQARRLRIWST
jgi:urease accessory protein